jgi:hypothetical protein
MMDASSKADLVEDADRVFVIDVDVDEHDDDEEARRGGKGSNELLD